MAANGKILALDIGGSSIKWMIFDISNGEPEINDVVARIPVQSRDFEWLRSAVIDLIRNNVDCSVVAISTTGSVDRSQRIIRSGFFDRYDGTSWKEIIADKIPSIRVFALNDGQASALAEHRTTGIPDVATSAHFVIGTGVGGGIIIRNELERGGSGIAGAIGHVKVRPEEGRKCSCGSTGCVQTEASATRVRELAEQRGLFFVSGDIMSLESIEDQDRTMLRQILTEAGHALGIGIGSVVNTLNPQLVTVGGGLALLDRSLGNGDGPYLLGARQAAQSNSLMTTFRDVEIQYAATAGVSGCLGATYWALDCMSGKAT